MKRFRERKNEGKQEAGLIEAEPEWWVGVGINLKTSDPS